MHSSSLVRYLWILARRFSQAAQNQNQNACSKIQPQKMRSPSSYFDLTWTMFRPYPNLTQTLPVQKSCLLKDPTTKDEVTQFLFRPYHDHVQTFPKPYPDLTHTHKHTCGVVWCGAVWCGVVSIFSLANDAPTMNGPCIHPSLL